MTYYNLCIIFLMAWTASSCLGQSISVSPSFTESHEFEGDQFRRLCYVETDDSSVASIRFQWIRDGMEIITQTSAAKELELNLQSVTLNDSGSYTCEATLFSATNEVLGTLTSTAESFTVVSVAHLDAPAVQIGHIGTNFSLQCTYENGLVRWTGSISGTFHPLTLADEGNYTCSITVFVSGRRLAINRQILLLVDAPLVITSNNQNERLTENRRVSLSATFTGRTAHNFRITWFHNNSAISPSDTRISTTLATDGYGESQTSLIFQLAQRKDKGMYRVEIVSAIGNNDPVRLERTFQLDVDITPVHPSSVSVAHPSSSTARASWELNNRTADSGAHTLILSLTYTQNRSLADTWTLPGSATTHLMEGLAPSTNYTLQVTAVNPDGMASSNTRFFATREGRPILNSVKASHFNATHVRIETEVAFTGGGIIRNIKVTYGPGMNVDLEVMHRDGLRNQAVFKKDEKMADSEVVLTVSVLNQHNYPSNDIQVTLFPYEPTTPSPTTFAATDASQIEESKMSLPAWLIPVVVAAGALVLIIVVILICVGVICFKCRRPKKGSLPVSALNGAVATTELKQLESGRQDDVYTPSQSGTDEEYRSRSQTGSLGSSTCGNHTPSLDKVHQHKRVPSDCSSNISIAKPNFVTPSSTPSLLVKGGPSYPSQEQGLQKIMEKEPSSHSSDDSCTESDRMDEQRNKVNAQQHRAPGDGSPCESMQSLPQQTHGCNLMMATPRRYNPKMLAQSDSRLFTGGLPLSRIGSPAHEYMYSDCESVASTEVSCGNYSLPPHPYPTHYHNVRHPSRHPLHYHTPSHTSKKQQPQATNASLKSVHERTATPYNRDFEGTEGSMV